MRRGRVGQDRIEKCIYLQTTMTMFSFIYIKRFVQWSCPVIMVCQDWGRPHHEARRACQAFSYPVLSYPNPTQPLGMLILDLIMVWPMRRLTTSKCTPQSCTSTQFARFHYFISKAFSFRSALSVVDVLVTNEIAVHGCTILIHF